MAVFGFTAISPRNPVYNLSFFLSYVHADLLMLSALLSLQAPAPHLRYSRHILYYYAKSGFKWVSCRLPTHHSGYFKLFRTPSIDDLLTS